MLNPVRKLKQTLETMERRLTHCEAGLMGIAERVSRLERDTASRDGFRRVCERLAELEKRTQPPVGMEPTPQPYRTTREEILGVLSAAKAPMKVAEISDACPDISYTSLKSELSRMAGLGLISRPAYGVYSANKRAAISGYGDHPSVSLRFAPRTPRAVGQKNGRA